MMTLVTQSLILSLFSNVQLSVCLLGRYERVHQNIKEGMGAIEALSAAAKKLPVR
jgi:hypothetical protein